MITYFIEITEFRLYEDNKLEHLVDNENLVDFIEF